MHRPAEAATRNCDTRAYSQILNRTLSVSSLRYLCSVSMSFDETAAVEGAATNGGSKTESGVEFPSEFFSKLRRLFVGSFVLVSTIIMCLDLCYRSTLTFLPEPPSDLPDFESIPIHSLLLSDVRSTFGVESGSVRMLHP